MSSFKLALNTSTLRPFQLNVTSQIDVAAQAGYKGIELWVRDIDHYLAGGGSLRELKQYIQDKGLTVINAIAFWTWTDRDEAVRKQGFEQAQREMEMLHELGCLAAAAPPFGNVEHVSLGEMAVNFAKLVEIGRRIGVEPILEFWGKAKQLTTLSEAVYVAMESGVPDATILLDPFHMYKGGSQIESLRYLNGERIGVVHVNDYPDEPGRADILDKHRLFPGEGIAPSQRLAQLLKQNGYDGYLSLELFIEDFGGMTALEVAKKGIETMKSTYSP